MSAATMWLAAKRIITTAATAAALRRLFSVAGDDQHLRADHRLEHAKGCDSAGVVSSRDGAVVALMPAPAASSRQPAQHASGRLRP